MGMTTKHYGPVLLKLLMFLFNNIIRANVSLPVKVFKELPDCHGCYHSNDVRQAILLLTQSQHFSITRCDREWSHGSAQRGNGAAQPCSLHLFYPLKKNKQFTSGGHVISVMIKYLKKNRNTKGFPKVKSSTDPCIFRDFCSLFPVSMSRTTCPSTLPKQQNCLINNYAAPVIQRQGSRPVIRGNTLTDR